jgi:hypothetical protein
MNNLTMSEITYPEKWRDEALTKADAATRRLLKSAQDDIDAALRQLQIGAPYGAHRAIKEAGRELADAATVALLMSERIIELLRQ